MCKHYRDARDIRVPENRELFKKIDHCILCTYEEEGEFFKLTHLFKRLNYNPLKNYESLLKYDWYRFIIDNGNNIEYEITKLKDWNDLFGLQKATMDRNRLIMYLIQSMRTMVALGYGDDYMYGENGYCLGFTWQKLNILRIQQMKKRDIISNINLTNQMFDLDWKIFMQRLDIDLFGNTN